MYIDTPLTPKIKLNQKKIWASSWLGSSQMSNIRFYCLYIANNYYN